MNRVERLVLLAAVLVAAALLVPLGVLVRDGWPPLRSWDLRAEKAVVLRPGVARDLVLALTQLGAPLLLEAVAVALVVVLLLRGRHRLAGYVALSVLGAEAVGFVAKEVVARVRPCAGQLSCPHSTSFPSGHAVGAAAFWTTAAVLLLPGVGRRAWVLVAVAPVVAVTRVLLGVHYPSDVAAGLLMGGCWAAGCTAVFSAWRQERAGREVPLEQGLEGSGERPARTG